jgi:hypothetical protein
MSELLSPNLLADGHIYQFDKYQKAYKAESSRNPGPTAATPVARTTSSSLIERATRCLAVKRLLPLGFPVQTNTDGLS